MTDKKPAPPGMYIKPLLNDGINYQPQLVSRISSINSITPPKFNIAPEKWWLEDYFPNGNATFEGLR